MSALFSGINEIFAVIEAMNELERSVIKAISPSLKEGRRADPINATLPHEIGAAGRSEAVPLRILTSPAVPWLKVARHFVTTAQPPLLQGGEITSIPIRNHGTVESLQAV